MSISLFARLNARYGRPVDPISRREFLAATTAAGAAMLLSNVTALGQSRPSGKRVVIVGAGFAGLAAGYELKAAGYDVTLIDPRAAPGGRVMTFKDMIPGKVIEGGAELIGTNHPTWAAYAEKFGLEALPMTEDTELEYPVMLGGKRLSGEECAALWEEMDAALAKMNEAAQDINADEPWKSPNAAEIDKLSLTDWLAKLDASALCKAGVAAQLVADNGVAADKMALLGMYTAVKGGGLEKYWTETETHRCKGGNQQLAAKLGEGIGRDRFVLKLPVTEILIKGDKCVVTCGDGRTLECDDVILTAAPSTWSKIKITPALPADLKPQMGVNLKWLSVVKERFWTGQKCNQYALTDDVAGWTWESTDNQGDTAPFGFTAFAGGPAAEKMTGKKTDEATAVYKKEVEKIFPGFAEKFESARFMDWPKDPWTLAGYSFPAPGQITKFGKTLYDGIGRLHFAGEYTSYKFVGYMEGGLNSGVSLARRLAQRDGVAK